MGAIDAVVRGFFRLDECVSLSILAILIKLVVIRIKIYSVVQEDSFKGGISDGGRCQRAKYMYESVD